VTVGARRAPLLTVASDPSILNSARRGDAFSRGGNCYKNSAMESFWISLKNELVYRRRFATRADARAAIFNYIESFYNRARRHSSLSYQSLLDYKSPSAN
jgi:transposase InsO family protein